MVSSILWKALSRRMPALLTNTSTRPKASRAACTIACPPFAVATLSWVGAATPPRAMISSPTRSAAVIEAPRPSTPPPQRRGGRAHKGGQDRQQGMLLALVQTRIVTDRVLGLTRALGGVRARYARRAKQHRLSRHAQRLGEGTEDRDRRERQPVLDLAQVGVGDPGQLGRLT